MGTSFEILTIRAAPPTIQELPSFCSWEEMIDKRSRASQGDHRMFTREVLDQMCFFWQLLKFRLFSSRKGYHDPMCHDDCHHAIFQSNTTSSLYQKYHSKPIAHLLCCIVVSFPSVAYFPNPLANSQALSSAFFSALPAPPR